MSTIPASIGGKYRVIKRLGEGGFGEVFSAQNELGAPYAIKLSKRAVDPKELEAFKRESILANRVGERTGHVAKMHAAGIDEATGRAYIVMDLLEGETLSQYVATAKFLRPVEAEIILKQVAHALSSAHELKIVHCDLKPDNVFMATNRTAAKSVSVYLLDFGIAKFRPNPLKTETQSTSAGSPTWMAPEQFEPSAISSRTDQWAFGQLAYWMLVGTQFPTTLRDGSTPASVGARAANRELPIGLDPWFARATAPNPANRFASIAEAFEKLSLVLAGQAALEQALTQIAPSAPTIQAANPPYIASAPVPPRAANSRTIVWKFAATFTLVATVTVAIVFAVSKGSNNPPPTFIPPRSPTIIRDPQELVHEWARRFGKNESLTELYAAHATIHGSTMSPDEWTQLSKTRAARGGSLTIDPITLRSTELSLEDSPRACQNTGGSSVHKVVVNANMNTVEGNPAVPCEVITGNYILWVTNVGGEYKICQESWDRCDALCRSCPQRAALCAGCANR